LSQIKNITMSKIKLKKGLDIKLQGIPKEEIIETNLSEFYAVKPTDFRNLTPKIVAKKGDIVKAGSVLFHDKDNEDILFTSPISGELVNIIRGERRKILEFIIKADSEIKYIEYKTGNAEHFSTDEIKNQLLKSGLWVRIIRRPFGIIPKTDETPKAIFISTFDTAPLAPNYNFTLKDSLFEFQTGIDILSKLCNEKIYLNINSKINNNIFREIKNVQINEFSGPHPAGNTGIQIHHINPINKGDVVWTINPQDVVFIGRLFKTGKLDLTKTIALAGSEVEKPQYYKVISGCQIETIVNNNLKSDNHRIISGNVLTGTKIEHNGFLGFYDNLISIIPEGNYYEMFGWAKPGLNKYSNSKFFLSWLRKNKKWNLDTNFHGGKRPFVLTGNMERVLPMDILPMHLLKSCLADDIDMLEKLGIYEILEEDFALCEFISETKMEFQEIIANAIELMRSEME